MLSDLIEFKKYNKRQSNLINNQIESLKMKGVTLKTEGH